MAQGTLEYLGHEVDVACNGLVAVEVCRKQIFDLILMDLLMPEMDGLEASRLIMENCRAKGLSPPEIFVLTASLSEKDRENCLKCGLTTFLKKPIEPEEFRRLVDKIYDLPPSSPLDVDELLSRVRDKTSLKKIAELYCQGYPNRLVELQKSVASQESIVAQRVAHTLKGNFLNFAFPLGAEIAHDLENLILAEDWKRAEELLPQLEQQCKLVEAALLDLLQESTDELTRPADGIDSQHAFTVLVADGDPANRAVCSGALQTEGYRVVEAADGEQVLEKLQAGGIDVVLMGVVMANLGGFETCRRIKSQAHTSMIPVLLVTALGEREARITGIEAGADDFINKPIEPREVSLRVRNAARAKGLFDRLQSSFEELKRLEELRDGLTHMLVHDLRTPLTAIKGYASLLTSAFGAGLSEQQKSFAERIVAQSNRLVDMVSTILDVSRLEADQMPLDTKEFSLSEVLREQSEAFLAMSEQSLILDLEERVQVKGDCELLRRVVSNLLANAFKYTPKGKSVTLRLRSDSLQAKVQVLDEGPGVPLEFRDRIFEKFAQVEIDEYKRPQSSGLGLSFCKLVLEKHSGTIGVAEAPGGGSDFWFSLPR